MGGIILNLNKFMDSMNKIFESSMKHAAKKSEGMYREAAKHYDASDPDSVERYRNARNVYNESNSIAGTNPGTMNLMNRLYGDKDAE